MFLGVINLQAKNIIMVLIAAAAQFTQARLAIWRNPNKGATLSQAEKLARQMAFVAPVVTIVIFYGFPAAVALYWITSSVFSILQQVIINKQLRLKFGENQ
jgi:YidC/Oxa1 family membrane protein insertase